MTEWKQRWGYELKPLASTPGVALLKDGRYLVWGKIGRHRRVMRAVDAKDVRDAQRQRLELLDSEKSKSSAIAQRSTPLFASYATSLCKRKVELREFGSQATIESWKGILENHLVPHFGPFPVDAIDRTVIEQWKTSVAKQIVYGKQPKLVAGRFSPNTANDWLRKLLYVLREAVAEFDLPRDPTLRIRYFPTAEHKTYSEDDPNSLAPERVAQWLRAFRAKWPQFFAFALLGFVTGLRPSTLRPLRRRGEESDIDWEQCLLRVRRSNARGQIVRNITKQGTQYTLGLPEVVMRELEAHVEALEGARSHPACALLFPSRGRGGGNTKAPFQAVPGMLSRSALDKPFEATSQALRLGFVLTPRGMRRTFQDLCRAAKVEDDVQKFICGHSTGPIAKRESGSRMTRHYSTFRPDETREAIAKIAKLVLTQPAKAKPKGRSKRRAA